MAIDIKEEAAYVSLKESLHREGHLSQVFLRTADQIASEAVASAAFDKRKDATVVEGSPIEPLLIEELIGDVSELLDRVMAYRKERKELEILAVKAELDYHLFLRQSSIEERIEIIRLRSKQAEIRFTANKEAAVHFGGAGDGIGAGYERLSEGVSLEAETLLKDASEEEKLISEKWDNLRNYNSAYNKRHTEVGNAHNYAERASRIQTLLNEDLIELFEKAEALKVGLEMIFGYKAAPMPEPTSVFFIDEMVLWTREQGRYFERQAEQEVEYDLVLPLVQRWSQRHEPLVTEEQFGSALQSTKSGQSAFNLMFDVSRDIFQGQRNVRLRGFGLAYGNRVAIHSTNGFDLNAMKESFVHLKATVTTPWQKRADGKTYRRPEIRFGSVGPFRDAGPRAFSDGSECLNLNPIGEWAISIDPNIIYKDGANYTIANGIDSPMRDLKLYMRIRARSDR